jgi:hypothetical protein
VYNIAQFISGLIKTNGSDIGHYHLNPTYVKIDSITNELFAIMASSGTAGRTSFDHAFWLASL